MPAVQFVRRTLFLGGLAAVLTTCAVSARQSGASSPTEPARTKGADVFAGVWGYNRLESVNAATGRPEEAPRSATSRGVGRGGGTRTSNTPAPGADALPGGSVAPGGAGSTGSGSTGTNSGGSGSSGPGSAGSDSNGAGSGGAGPSGGFGGQGGGGFGSQGAPSAAGLAAQQVRENRDLARDLLEVPQSLMIATTPSAVTMIDDLNRSRTYPTDGGRRKYQLGAAQYEATVEWADGQLRKHITGPYGFRMLETFFLSPDGKRLFVIVRVGEQKKDGPVVGFNRVYDRLDTPSIARAR